MKKISLLMTLVIVFSITSCKKYLDVNTDPNRAISATPDLILPQAITAVANQTWGVPTTGAAALGGSYNFYGSQVVGYLANGGGVSGWGAIISYNYSATDQQSLWNFSYDVANDIQYIINNTEGQASFVQYNAAAKVLKAYVFQRLVDQYGDLPYTNALKGAQNLTASYDKATDIYKSLADLCDAAITQFKANPIASTTFRTADVMFNSSSSNTVEIINWIKFANTLKLRLILRGANKVAFANKTFDSIGFLTDDAVVNPGYAKVSGKQNPAWNSFAYTFAGAVVTAGTQYVPTPYIMGFYNGAKLTDLARANVTYKLGRETPTNQLGSLLATAGRGQTPNSWFIGTNSTNYASIGIFKGPDAPQPLLLLLADSYFLQAEGVMKGLITGDAKTYFDNGIQASFRYLYKTSTNAVTSGKDPVADGKAYQTANSTSYLTNYNLATTDDQRLEAIITQKYLALNMLFGDEAWNEYRRTGYPANNVSASATPIQTFNSIVGESTATDKLPARLQYPSTEFTYNAANVPTVDKYTSKIFWAK